MQHENHKITILSVSFYSSRHLSRVFANLIDKCYNKKDLHFLVIDNTNGEDKNLINLQSNDYDLSLIMNKSDFRQRSRSHAEGLDAGLELVQTKYTLIIDPDIHIFKQDWDSFLLKEIEKSKLVGVPYPPWKIGKVHDFPSVVFMFFETAHIRSLKKSFSPFPSLPKTIKNSLYRKINRMGFLANKTRLDRYKKLRLVTSNLESFFGVTSPDTGNEIISAMRELNCTSTNLNACYGSDLSQNATLSHQMLAKYFELYLDKNEIFLTHMYGSGVFHWKTKKSNNLDYWLLLISEIEKEKQWII